MNILDVQKLSDDELETDLGKTTSEILRVRQDIAQIRVSLNNLRDRAADLANQRKLLRQELKRRQ